MRGFVGSEAGVNVSVGQRGRVIQVASFSGQVCVDFRDPAIKTWVSEKDFDKLRVLKAKEHPHPALNAYCKEASWRGAEVPDGAPANDEFCIFLPWTWRCDAKPPVVPDLNVKLWNCDSQGSESPGRRDRPRTGSAGSESNRSFSPRRSSPAGPGFSPRNGSRAAQQAENQEDRDCFTMRDACLEQPGTPGGKNKRPDCMTMSSSCFDGPTSRNSSRVDSTLTPYTPSTARETASPRSSRATTWRRSHGW